MPRLARPIKKDDTKPKKRRLTEKEQVEVKHIQEKIDRKRDKKPWIRANRGLPVHRNYILVSTKDPLYPDIIKQCTKDHRGAFPWNNLSVNFSPDKTQAVIQVARRKRGWFSSFKFSESVEKLTPRALEKILRNWE